MKNSDIALIILISVMSIGISYWIMGMVMGNPSEKVAEINYLPTIQGTVNAPDSETFNAYSTNLNLDVIVGYCQDFEVWDAITGTCADRKDSSANIMNEQPAETPDAETGENGSEENPVNGEGF